ncbi:MAG: MFS transporter [Candidatus Acidiferrales bacterium]
MRQQRWLRIIPAALITYTIAYTDRTNISMALPSLSRDLHLDPAQAGGIAGIFFWGYLLLQIPGGQIANWWSAKRFIAILMVAWGIASVGCGLVRTGPELWWMRLLLGVTQGGVFSATLVLVSHWFPRRERARANAMWLVCGPLALIISSPLSGLILDRWDWRVMLIVEGTLPFLWLAIWLNLIYDHPREAKWISPEEREYLDSTLEREAAGLEPVKPAPILASLVRPQLILLILIYFLRMSAEFGFLFWLPSALEKAKTLSHVGIGGLATGPFLVGIIAMLLISWHSDRTGERRGHISAAFALGGIFLLMGVLTSQRWPALAFVFICLTGIGTYGALGPFWAIPSETLPRNVAASVMGVVTAIGSLGGFFGPLAVGYLNKHTGSFLYGYGLLGIGLLMISVLSLLISSPVSLPALRSSPDNAS